MAEEGNMKNFIILLGIATAYVPVAAWSQSDDDFIEEEVGAQRLPQSVGALGDSMTAAALAGHRRKDSLMPWVLIGLLSDALQYGVNRSVRAIEQPKLSWATGSSRLIRSMPSHWSRLSTLQGSKIPFHNAALSGAESEHVLNTQVDELRQWSRKELKQEFPDYVSLLIGANDLCAKTTAEMVSTTDFYSNIENVVSQILAAESESKVVVASLPDVVKLRDVAKNARDFGFTNCERVWKRVKLCPTLTTLDDAESRFALASRLEQYNDAMRDIVRRQRQLHGDRVRFAKKLATEDFTADELAVDCFHPNREGQAKLSESTFSETWWNQPWLEKREQLKKDFLAQQKRDCAPVTGKQPMRPAICSEKWIDPN
jgi:hypothetical protein